MIETLEMIQEDRHEAYRAGRLDRIHERCRAPAGEAAMRGDGRRGEVPVADKEEATDLGQSVPKAPQSKGLLRSFLHTTRDARPQTRDTATGQHCNTRATPKTGRGATKKDGGLAHTTWIPLGEARGPNIQHDVPLIGHGGNPSPRFLGRGGGDH